LFRVGIGNDRTVSLAVAMTRVLGPGNQRRRKFAEARERFACAAVSPVALNGVKDQLLPAPTDEPAERSFSISSAFNTAAQWTSRQCGRASTFAVACTVIVVWAVTGPLFDYSDTWQLIINTGTTIITFLMVFLIQNTQNRDSTALHLKLDELIRVSESARNRLLDLEGLTEDELDHLKASFTKLADHPPDATLLREAVDDLDAAGAGIRGAKAKVAAAQR
jgi:low affinity Fe/Cu permease